ncbi:hypothetical protein WA171_006369, partial [Blastocystis sp. BT1]
MERDVKYPIVLGESITSEDKEKLLLRYSFVPQSLNRSKPAVLSFGEHGINVQATFFDDYKENGTKTLTGVKKVSTGNDYILVFKNNQFILERVGGFVNQLSV